MTQSISPRKEAKGKTGHVRKQLAREAVLDRLEGNAEGEFAEWVMKAFERELIRRGIGLMTLREWEAQS